MIGCSKEYGMGVQDRNLELLDALEVFIFWKIIMKKETKKVLEFILENYWIERPWCYNVSEHDFLQTINEFLETGKNITKYIDERNWF